ncbi:ATP-grasp domain-containing protein [Deinococcus cellulosilyticus]|uniref:ATP-grasp domain-containing protein n=1 Tax=Deinococcus cellulosilyticus (strain DSM 18568 / NBRC 106333 / KACC 11606 / 5516J-15) TaxID=1223518 RepID=A0A511NAG0_DEIC1|nr:ATP-grasp domain-containing protein [Deinococcus cellulosilyticus]GEM49815.1 hypothetical protein DC3_54500 [Deinococcus cellulosilyticus NBRC 106333 = KACC 11606]
MSNLMLLDQTLWILEQKISNQIYDFPFEHLFACSHPYHIPAEVQAIARIGAIPDYPAFYQEWLHQGVRMINTPDEHLRASELPGWYPLLTDLTPRSIWFDHLPSSEDIERQLDFPVFIKGARQTSQHQASLCVASDSTELKSILEGYQQDPILYWQTLVCRELLPLRILQEGQGDQLPVAFEFRTFWYRGELAGLGRYWLDGPPYSANREELQDLLNTARTVVERLNVPFLVVDVAQTASGRWVVIECNDAQESGYAGVSAVALWQKIIELEKKSSVD